jgi:hypothetical protein
VSFLLYFELYLPVSFALYDLLNTVLPFSTAFGYMQYYFSKEIRFGTHTVTQNFVGEGGLVFLSGLVQKNATLFERRVVG